MLIILLALSMCFQISRAETAPVNEPSKTFYYEGFLTLRNTTELPFLCTIFSTITVPTGKTNLQYLPYGTEYLVLPGTEIILPKAPVGIFATKKDETGNEKQVPLWGLKSILLSRPIINYDETTKYGSINLDPKAIVPFQFEAPGIVSIKEEDAKFVIKKD